MCPLNEVKVCIWGQDPYHNRGEAMGLCFSVHESCKIPPSLRNIFKELQDDLHITKQHGDLTSWGNPRRATVEQCAYCSRKLS